MALDRKEILDSTPCVMLTVGQLRMIVREEIQAELDGKTDFKNLGSSEASRPYLTIRETADLARVASSTVRLYIRKGQLRPQKIGRRIIIARAELDRFLSLNLSHVVLH